MPLVFGVLVLIVSALVQATLVSELLRGPRPDLVLIFVLAWSMSRGVVEGTIGGIAGGLSLDLLSAVPFGLHTALLGLIGAAAGLGEANLYRGNVPLFLVTAALATLLLHGGTALGLQAAGQQTTGFLRFVQFLVPTAFLNALIMPVAFSLVQRGVRALAGWRQLEL